MDPATPAISKNPNLTALLSAENGLAPYRDPLGCPSTDSNQSLSQSHLSIPPVTGDDDGNIDSIGVDGTIISPATTSLASEALSEASPSQALVPSHLSKRLFAREDGDANPAAFPPPQQALVRYSDRFDRVPDCGAHPQSYLSNPSAVQDNREIGATGTDSTRSGLEATTAALESTMMPKATSSEGSASMLESGDIGTCYSIGTIGPITPRTSLIYHHTDASSWFVMLGAVSIFEPYTCREPIRDVLDLILQYLIMVLSKSQLHQYTRPKVQSRISRTSLTCRHWARKLRLLLFEDVKLKTMDDVRFVLTMLHSPTSSWLADHILAVILYPGVEHPYPHEATLEACKEVLRLCRSVGYIDVSHSTKTIRKNHLSICTQRPFLRTLSKLRILRLEFVVFPSLSSLFRLIGSLEQLQYLNILGPFWKKTNDTTTDVMPWQTPPSCRAMFKQMKTTLWSEGPDNMAAVWLFAGRSIQHSYKMRFKENEETLPLELAAIVRLIYTLCPGSGRDTVEARMLLDRDGEHHSSFFFLVIFLELLRIILNLQTPMHLRCAGMAASLSGVLPSSSSLSICPALRMAQRQRGNGSFKDLLL